MEKGVLDELLQRIHWRRQTLNCLVEQHGLGAPAVLAASQCLDQVIVEYQRCLQMRPVRTSVALVKKNGEKKIRCKTQFAENREMSS